MILIFTVNKTTSESFRRVSGVVHIVLSPFCVSSVAPSSRLDHTPRFERPAGTWLAQPEFTVL